MISYRKVKSIGANILARRTHLNEYSNYSEEQAYNGEKSSSKFVRSSTVKERG